MSKIIGYYNIFFDPACKSDFHTRGVFLGQAQETLENATKNIADVRRLMPDIVFIATVEVEVRVDL